MQKSFQLRIDNSSGKKTSDRGRAFFARVNPGDLAQRGGLAQIRFELPEPMGWRVVCLDGSRSFKTPTEASPPKEIFRKRETNSCENSCAKNSQYRENQLAQSSLPRFNMDQSETGCCPRFDPTGWDGQEFESVDRAFVRATTISFLHIPLNMGSVIKKAIAKIEKAGAAPTEECFMLSSDLSPWRAEHFFAVTKDVPDASQSLCQRRLRITEGTMSGLRPESSQCDTSCDSCPLHDLTSRALSHELAGTTRMVSSGNLSRTEMSITTWPLAHTLRNLFAPLKEKKCFYPPIFICLLDVTSW